MGATEADLLVVAADFCAGKDGVKIAHTGGKVVTCDHDWTKSDYRTHVDEGS